MKEGKLKYNNRNRRYGLVSSDIWLDTGLHCGESLEVRIDDRWIPTRIEMDEKREWYLIETSYCGNLENVQVRR